MSDERYQFAFAPDAARVALNWLHGLKSERRMAAKTLEAYGQDVLQFGAFLTNHLGVAPDVSTLAILTASDFRSFMAKRRSQGLESRSLARQMSAIRSFFRHAERSGDFKCAALGVVRAPKIAHSVPRPLPEHAARLVAQADVFEHDEPWVKARDAAVLTLLYACGLRISEALNLTVKQAQTNPLVVLGKGSKTRIVPMVSVAQDAIATYLKLCPLVLGINEPMFRGVKGGQIQQHRMRCGIALLRIFWEMVLIFASFKIYSVMPACPARRFTLR
jgi:integrase/recombinase XerC